MGAGRLRVVRQLLTESVLLASLGGALGIALALWGVRVLTSLLANGREDFTLRAGLNWHVLTVAAGLSVLTGVLFGLAPAIQSTGIDVMPALKNDLGQPARSAARLRFLIAAQLAIALLVLVAAGLFTRTLSNLNSIQLGFNRENLLLFEIDAQQAGHRNPEIADFLPESTGTISGDSRRPQCDSFEGFDNRRWGDGFPIERPRKTGRYNEGSGCRAYLFYHHADSDLNGP